jgi:hypothetical protein
MPDALAIVVEIYLTLGRLLMSVPKNPRNPIENRLLANLPREKYERLLPKMETVSLDFKQVLY